MALEGTLESFSIAEIFQLIASQAKTGILEIDTGDNVARISFVNGQMLFAYPGKAEPGLYIGGMLVRAGLVTDNQLEYALGLQKRSLRKLGDILIRMGTIRTREFQEMLALQRREMAFSLLRLKKGRYVFTPSEVEFEEGVDTLMNVDAILMEGSRQIDEWPAVLKKIPTETRIYMRKVEAAPMRELTEEEVIVYGLLDGTLTVREVVDRSRLGEFPAWDAIANLYDEGLITHIEVQKRRIPKPQPSFEAAAKKESRALDTAVGTLLLALGAAAFLLPILKPAGSMGIGSALKAKTSDLALVEARIEKWENRMPLIPEKVRKGKTVMVLPSER